MKKLSMTIFLSFGLLSVSAFADVDYGVEVGIRQQSGDVEGNSTSNSQMGYQFGATAHFPISGPLHLRSGMLYTQRPLVSKSISTGIEEKISMNYLDVPVALLYKFEEYAGVYAGIVLGLNIDKSADRNTVITDVKSPLMPLIFGASFKFAPNLGANLYFESASGDAAKGFKNYRAVGANLQLTFD